ncbi:hypothetical protein BGX38DRAFT_1258034 [Terfezia claveryi]|nr:hypothetical protein BGX38DRAFT_1258034 [Terfezia claveryi]
MVERLWWLILVLDGRCSLEQICCIAQQLARHHYMPEKPIISKSSSLFGGVANGTDAKLFAEKVWAIFGNQWHYFRPFGEAIVDGFDRDFENGPAAGYEHCLPPPPTHERRQSKYREGMDSHGGPTMSSARFHARCCLEKILSSMRSSSNFMTTPLVKPPIGYSERIKLPM